MLFSAYLFIPGNTFDVTAIQGVIMDKKIIALIAVIAAVAIIAAAAFFLMGGEKEKDVTKVDAEYALQILGNADEDMTINDKDVTIIREIIKGNLKFSDYPFADANNDGKVTQDDVKITSDLASKKSGTKAYVVNINKEGNRAVTEVTYPLSKIVPYGINIVAPIMTIDGGRCVAAYFASAYPNNEASMQGVDLKGGSRSIGDAAWQNFLTTDASVHFDAFVYTYDARAQVLDTYISDMNEAKIPILCYPAADADGELRAAVTLGFLFGGKSETLGLKYADIYLNILDQIKNKVGGKTDAQKTTYIAMNMDTSICQNDSTYNTMGAIAGGIPYYKTDSAFAEKYKGTSSSAASTVEALSNVNADKFLSYRSIDHLKSGDDIKKIYVDRWEYSNSKGVMVKDLFEYSDDEDLVIYINNILPAPVRVAYSLYWLYPDIFSKTWADSIMQKFIDEGFTPYAGKTIGKELVTTFTYQDYKNAKS